MSPPVHPFKNHDTFHGSRNWIEIQPHSYLANISSNKLSSLFLTKGLNNLISSLLTRSCRKHSCNRLINGSIVPCSLYAFISLISFFKFGFSSFLFNNNTNCWMSVLGLSVKTLLLPFSVSWLSFTGVGDIKAWKDVI